MTNYKLLIYGFGIDGSAHVLTSEEVQKIRDFQQEAGYDSLVDLYTELPMLLEGYDHYDTNYWVASTPIATPSFRLVLLDENDEVLWEAKMEELSKTFMDDFEYPEDADDHSKLIDAFPYDEKPNILLVYEEVKGTLVDFTIESEEQPKPLDFAVTVQSMETPEYELELVDKVFFKGSQLERQYDKEHYWGKGLNVELFTLEDLDNEDEDWDDEEE
jgi:hypothetical protein